MVKISNSASDKLLLKFTLRAALSSVISLLLFSYASAEIYCRLDIGTNKINVISVFVYAVCAVITAFVSVSGFKNNGASVGILSQLFLILYSLFNLIFASNTLILFTIKLAVSVSAGALIGHLRVKRSSEFKI